MSKIELQNVNKLYNDFQALTDISFEIEDGEFCVVLGASGSGKTTLLNIISGLDRPSSGNVNFNDKKVNALDPKRRNIAMVFQDYALYPHMTVYQNMAFPLKVNRVPKEKINSIVTDTAKTLSIEPLMKRKPKELSGGQAQRVALGRALVRNPSVFLMDEPLSNLDAKIRSQVRTELKLLHGNLMKTFVYVTHDQQEAMALADKVILINKGVVEQIGTPQDIYTRPGSVHVASFIGDPPMNMFSAKKSDSVFSSDVGNIEIDNPEISELVLGIRPESIQTTTPEGEFFQFEIDISAFELFGAYGVVTAETSSGLEVKIRSTEKKVELGKRKVYTARGDVHLFNGETQLRIDDDFRIKK